MARAVYGGLLRTQAAMLASGMRASRRHLFVPKGDGHENVCWVGLLCRSGKQFGSQILGYLPREIQSDGHFAEFNPLAGSPGAVPMYALETARGSGAMQPVLNQGTTFIAYSADIVQDSWSHLRWADDVSSARAIELAMCRDPVERQTEAATRHMTVNSALLVIGGATEDMLTMTGGAAGGAAGDVGDTAAGMMVLRLMAGLVVVDEADFAVSLANKEDIAKADRAMQEMTRRVYRVLPGMAMSATGNTMDAYTQLLSEPYTYTDMVLTDILAVPMMPERWGQDIAPAKLRTAAGVREHVTRFKYTYVNQGIRRLTALINDTVNLCSSKTFKGIVICSSLDIARDLSCAVTTNPPEESGGRGGGRLSSTTVIVAVDGTITKGRDAIWRDVEIGGDIDIVFVFKLASRGFGPANVKVNVFMRAFADYGNSKADAQQRALRTAAAVKTVHFANSPFVSEAELGRMVDSGLSDEFLASLFEELGYAYKESNVKCQTCLVPIRDDDDNVFSGAHGQRFHGTCKVVPAAGCDLEKALAGRCRRVRRKINYSSFVEPREKDEHELDAAPELDDMDNDAAAEDAHDTDAAAPVSHAAEDMATAAAEDACDMDDTASAEPEETGEEPVEEPVQDDAATVEPEDTGVEPVEEPAVPAAEDAHAMDDAAPAVAAAEDLAGQSITCTRHDCGANGGARRTVAAPAAAGGWPERYTRRVTSIPADPAAEDSVPPYAAPSDLESSTVVCRRCEWYERIVASSIGIRVGIATAPACTCSAGSAAAAASNSRRIASAAAFTCSAGSAALHHLAEAEAASTCSAGSAAVNAAVSRHIAAAAASACPAGSAAVAAGSAAAPPAPQRLQSPAVQRQARARRLPSKAADDADSDYEEEQRQPPKGRRASCDGLELLVAIVGGATRVPSAVGDGVLRVACSGSAVVPSDSETDVDVRYCWAMLRERTWVPLAAANGPEASGLMTGKYRCTATARGATGTCEASLGLQIIDTYMARASPLSRTLEAPVSSAAEPSPAHAAAAACEAAALFTCPHG
ncbi:hypothetical protein JKP88DRAFT_325489 [Tribonema minus]|uniref:Uncharacterized protein n=1 Tax=Tribonema minus TaxID=303371 RepID=A0A835YZE9_9STRA|nr:hypothetical protein JKP88DRAFT_325489 [Tribonema minus]